jgi:hypothetical protein
MPSAFSVVVRNLDDICEIREKVAVAYFKSISYRSMEGLRHITQDLMMTSADRNTNVEGPQHARQH